MYKFLSKNGTLIAFVLGALVIAISLIVIFSGLEEFNALPSKKPDDERGTTTIFNLGLAAVVGMTILSAIAIVGFGIYHIATNIKGNVKALAGVGILAVFALITYFTASGVAETDKLAALFVKNNISEGSSKLISAGLMSTVALAGIATLGLVLSEVRNFFK